MLRWLRSLSPPVDPMGLDPGWRTFGAAARRLARRLSLPECEGQCGPGAPPEQLHGATRQDRGGSSRRPHERCEVADWPEVRQLVGVADGADARDLTAGDVERQDGDQALLCVEIERSRTAVDLDGADRHARTARGEAHRVADQRARDTGPATQRPRQGRNLAAAVGGQLHVVGEQRLEPSEVALLGGREEPSRELVALLARALEAWAALLDVASRSRRELADVVLALADDLGDLRVVVVEHVVQQQHRALLR